MKRKMIGTRHTPNVSRCTADVGISHVLELVSLTMAAMDSGDSDGYGGSDGSKDRVSNDAAKSVKDPSGYDDSSWHGAQGLNAAQVGNRSFIKTAEPHLALFAMKV